MSIRPHQHRSDTGTSTDLDTDHNNDRDTVPSNRTTSTIATAITGPTVYVHPPIKLNIGGTNAGTDTDMFRVHHLFFIFGNTLITPTHILLSVLQYTVIRCRCLRLFLLILSDPATDN